MESAVMSPLKNTPKLYPCICVSCPANISTVYRLAQSSVPVGCTGSLIGPARCSDYGYDRRMDGKCSPAFWFHPSSMSRSCTTETTFLKSTG